MKKLILYTFSLLLLLLACTSVATPSPTTGEIRGTIIDASNGTAIAAANVSTDPPTSAVTTDDKGNFSIPDVLPGKYTVTATKLGYDSASVKVAVAASKATRSDIQLPAAAAHGGAATTTPALANDLLLYYPFDGDTNDASGNGNDGVVYGAQWVEGKIDKALELDGRDNYIRADGHFEFSTDNEISLMAWFKLADRAGSRTDFCGVISTYQCCAYRLLVSPRMHPYYDAGTHKDTEVPSFTFQSGRWYHYALTIGDGVAKVFVNGDRIFADSQGIPLRLPNVEDAFIIGSGQQSGTPGKLFHPMDGIVDEVRIYRRALSEEEMQGLYQEGAR